MIQTVLEKIKLEILVAMQIKILNGKEIAVN